MLTETNDAASSTHTSQTRAILTFRLSGFTYGLLITDIIQIIEMVTIIHLPQSPDSVQGVINFHGTAVPVVDLRIHFNLPFQAYGAHTPIILIQFNDRSLGLIVDSVDEVLEIRQEQVIKPDSVLTAELTTLEVPNWEALYLSGLADIDRKLVPILQADALLSRRQQEQLDEVIPDDLAADGQRVS